MKDYPTDTDEQRKKYKYQAIAIVEADEEQTKLDELREYYAKNPFVYLTERLGVNPAHIDWNLIDAYKSHKWHGTENPLKKIIDEIAQSNWIGVESAKGVSKTWLAARLVLWFLECFENSLVVTTAPKEDQLTLHIWREISLIFPKFAKGNLTKLELAMKDDKSWLAVGFVAGSGTIEEAAQRASGFHNEHMLIILEETPGINQKVITTLQSQCSSPHNIILALGNPDHQLDNLHRFCLLENVKHIRISGFDYPNVVLKNDKYIPGGQSQIGLSRLLTNCKSKDNPLYQSFAEGISPSESVWSLIKLEWIQKAVQNYNALLDFKGKLKLDEVEGELSLGVDVSNSESGDEAAICKGKGNVCYSIESFPCPDANKLGDMVALICEDESIKKSNVQIDGVGVGAGTVNKLKEYEFDEDEINFIGSAKPVEKDEVEQYLNRRSQAWWLCRKDLQDGKLALPDDPELIQDLLAPQWERRRGKICIEEKAKIKLRIGRSPNKGDAFVMWNFNRHKEMALKMFIMKK